MEMMLRFIVRNPRYAAQNVRNLSAVHRAMKAYHAEFPCCRWCGGTEDVETHHIKPVRERPDLAAEKTNFWSLCRRMDCHRVVGHFGDYKRSNPHVVECCMEAIPLAVKGWIEIDPREIGKTYKTPEEFVAHGPCGKCLTVPKGWKYDSYTFVPNLADWRPAAAHDYAYKRKRWDDGSPITRSEADEMLYALMSKSWNPPTVDWAWTFWAGVRLFGWWSWLRAKIKGKQCT